jgi:amino acid transporter
MLIVLLPVFGLAGFHILMPLTAVVLGLLVLTTLSYRQVVMIYTRAGGSYVVARENFGPRVAQIASVALLIDYIVTVAVQSAAGIAAITSLVPALNSPTNATVITIAVILVLAYGNLRGVREAVRRSHFPRTSSLSRPAWLSSSASCASCWATCRRSLTRPTRTTLSSR